MGELILSQLTDIFRIGLLVGLVYTTARTAAVTGRLLPLLAGIAFVAILIPTTQGNGGWPAMAAGLVSNAILVAVMLGALALYQRLRGGI